MLVYSWWGWQQCVHPTLAGWPIVTRICISFRGLRVESAKKCPKVKLTGCNRLSLEQLSYQGKWPLGYNYSETGGGTTASRPPSRTLQQ